MLRKSLVLLKPLLSCLLASSAINAYEMEDANSTSNAIIGGEMIEKGSRPYLVSLGRGDKGEYQACGGSLISPHAVLTAAHCLFDLETGEWYPPEWVEFNRHDLCDDTGVVRLHLEGTQCYGDIIYHSGFSIDTMDYDVAILFLPIGIIDITPVILNTDQNVPSDDAPLDVAGWGQFITHGYDAYPTLPFATTVDYLSNEVCTVPPYKKLSLEVTEQMMCAYAKKTDSCHGDSGGPIVLSKGPEGGVQTPVVQVGIVSWGDKCAKKKSPGVYSRISSFVDWISNAVCDRTGELCKTVNKRSREGGVRHLKREQNNANDECIKVPVYVTTEPTIPILCVAEDQSPEEEPPETRSGKSAKDPNKSGKSAKDPKKSGKSAKDPKSKKARSIEIFE